MLTLCHTRTYPLGTHEMLSNVEKGKAVPILVVIKGVDTTMIRIWQTATAGKKRSGQAQAAENA